MSLVPESQRRSLAGIVLIGAGAVLLAFQFFGGSAEFFWPFFIVVPGAALVGLSMAAKDAFRWLAIPGSIVCGIGLILLYQNTFDHFESWAYAWSLIPFFIGLGTMLSADTDEAGGEKGDNARQMMTWSIVGFLVLALVFEVIIFGRGGIFARVLVPLLLIGGGVLVLYGKSAATDAPAMTETKDARDETSDASDETGQSAEAPPKA